MLLDLPFSHQKQIEHFPQDPNHLTQLQIHLIWITEEIGGKYFAIRIVILPEYYFGMPRSETNHLHLIGGNQC